MSLRTRRQGAAIVAKKEVVYGQNVTLPNVTLILGQQTFTSTSFAFARKQSLVTALLYNKPMLRNPSPLTHLSPRKALDESASTRRQTIDVFVGTGVR